MDRNSKGIWLPFSWRKLSFFQVIFLSLFFILLISSSIQILLYSGGVNRSLDRWEQDKVKRLEKAGLDYILHGREPKFQEPITIYDEQKRPIVSNRRGMMMMDKVMIPLIDRSGKVIGYISTRGLPFKEIEENRKLINSLLSNLLISALISLILSLLLSYLISKKLSKSTVDIKNALINIKNKDMLDFIPSGAKEIVEIGKGVKDLAIRLENEEKLRSQWLHDISHDLKTPVTALKIQFESMLYGSLSIDKNRIEQNNKEVKRLESIILSINEIMKVETPDYELTKELISVKSVFNDLNERFSGDVLNGRTIQFKTEETSVIHADKDLLFKALSNLIDNGVKYSNIKSTITCKYKNNKISISNNGPKINDKDKLFDRLYRGDSSRNSEGTGLGLSIVKAIADRHGWDVLIESENGINSFIITII